MVKIAVMGYGVVGSGVVEVVEKHKNDIAKKIDSPIEIKYILDLRDFPDSPYGSKHIKNFETILSDGEVQIVVETMGGIKPAYEYTKSLLLSGKSVVTSNKELVAQKGAELLEIAKQKNVNYLFEASVGGGIPIIRPISQCLAANELKEIVGILNGTTNYILTQMIKNGKSFDEALKDAQQKGYAERNPAADVEGHDACRKICILSSLAFGRHLYPEKVHTEGITKITLEDVEYAASWNGVIKLLARSKRFEDGRVYAIVSPCFIKNTHQLANVEDVFNGILVRGDVIGDVVFYGRGAGKLPTASAVVADIIDAAKHLSARKWLYWKDVDYDFTVDYWDTEAAYYIRAILPDNLNWQTVTDIFGDVRRLTRDKALKGEAAFIIGAVKEREFARLCESFEAKDAKILSKIRVIEE